MPSAGCAKPMMANSAKMAKAFFRLMLGQLAFFRLRVAKAAMAQVLPKPKLVTYHVFFPLHSVG